MTRDKAIVGLLAVLAIVAAIGYAYMFSSLGCSANGSCPAQARINGNDYGISGNMDLPGVEARLVPVADATGTLAATYLREATLYGVGDVDPELILIGRAQAGEDPGEYVVLFSVERSREAWAALCANVATDDPGSPAECGDGSTAAPTQTRDPI